MAIVNYTHPVSKAFCFQWKALWKLCQLFIEGFAVVHVSIFTEIFKAGLPCKCHMPAEAYLDPYTLYENIWFSLFQVLGKHFLRQIHDNWLISFNDCLVFLFSSREWLCKNETNLANVTHTNRVTHVPQLGHFLTTVQSWLSVY